MNKIFTDNGWKECVHPRLQISLWGQVDGVPLPAIFAYDKIKRKCSHVLCEDNGRGEPGGL